MSAFSSSESVDLKRVLVTGASGFVGAHVVNQLLESGYSVRGTTESISDPAVTHLYSLRHASERLQMIPCNFSTLEAAAEAVADMDLIIHTFWPHDASAEESPTELHSAAMTTNGNLLEAAFAHGKAKRIVMLSSVSTFAESFDNGRLYTEADWNSVSSISNNVFKYNRTQVERAALDFVKAKPDVFDLVTINPFIVLGPPLLPSPEPPSSIEIVYNLTKGDLVKAPNIGLAVVDVRDVASSLVRAALTAIASGRYACVNNPSGVKVLGIAASIRAQFPSFDKRLPKSTLPDMLVSAVARTRSKPRKEFMLSNLGKLPMISNSKIVDELGIIFRPLDATIADTVQWLVENGHISSP